MGIIIFCFYQSDSSFGKEKPKWYIELQFLNNK